MKRHFNFADLFELAADKVPDRVAVVDRRRRVTYRELEERANRLAHALQDAGVQPGQHVGILATNCIEWVEAMFAVYKIRGSVVNVNFRYVEDELRYLFDNSDMVALVYQREYGPLIAAARDAQPKLQTFVRIEWDGSDADDSGARPDRVRSGARRGLARARLRRTLRRRHLPALHRRHDRHAEGRDVAPGGRLLRARRRHRRVHARTRAVDPETASEKIDASQPSGLIMMPIPPLMHGAGQMGTLRVAVRRRHRGDHRSLRRRRGVAHRRSASASTRSSVTGDAMARRSPTRSRRCDDELDLSCVVSFSSTAAIFSQTVKEQLQRLLPDYVVMTDAIGSTESGMNGIRVVQKGDAPKEGITSVQASADSVVLDDDFEPIVPGSGEVGRVARGGNIPLGYYNDPVKTAEMFVTDAHGQAVVDPRRLRDGRSRRSHHAARSRFGVDQLRWREDLSRKRSKAR